MSREVSSTCECILYRCDECDEMFIAEYDPYMECPECGGSNEIHEFDPGVDCDCYENGKFYAQQTWAQWKELNPSPTEWYLIEGKNMGWMNRSGTKIIDDHDEIFDLLQVDGEWTQYWPEEVKTGQDLAISLSHHDSPTGEAYTVRPATIEEVIVGIMEDPEHENTWIGDIQYFLDEHFDPNTIDETRFRELAEEAFFDADEYWDNQQWKTNLESPFPDFQEREILVNGY